MHLGQVTPRQIVRVGSGSESVFAASSMARRLRLGLRARRDSTGLNVCPKAPLRALPRTLWTAQTRAFVKKRWPERGLTLRSHRRSRRFKSGHLHQKAQVRPHKLPGLGSVVPSTGLNVLGPEASARPWAPRRRDGCACGTSTWSRAGVLAVLVAGNTEFSRYSPTFPSH